MARGKFITLEGGEGSGKSTQAGLLKQALETRGHAVLATREPGGSPAAEDIRKLVVEGAPDRWTALTEALLFLAARSDHVARVIEPALRAGQWVICDRFSDSTYVYQGAVRGLGVDTVKRLQAAVPGVPVPDLTLVLDIDPADGLARAHARRGNTNETRFEQFGEDFHIHLRSAFIAIAKSEPMRCVLVNAAGSPKEVAARIWHAVEERLTP